ncbi:RDD family protein [Clostridium sp. C2-6-12]|uniref:RDD family protein n=1 Tax=Clostridium sp. C2-6-12 TaxID=2698832 RepID=UPI001372163F|nr:RDD family protein [Clostridium sp. C2-6-12]
MENNNIKENETVNEAEENEVKVSEEIMEANVNTELHNLVNEDVTVKNEKSSIKSFLANILDQTLLIAASAILIILLDQIIRLFGYMFVRETGGIILAAGIIYFILNCIYAPIMEKTRAKATIANKILNIN